MINWGATSYRRLGPLLPLIACVGIAVLDLAAGLRHWPVPVKGLLDEPAHLLTAWLVLSIVPPQVFPSGLWRPALVASVAIDIDHVPLYLSGGRFAVHGARPPTHSLATVAALAALGLLVPRLRWALGAAVGVALHFLRDVATDAGIPALWPASDTVTRAPYWSYLMVIAALGLSLTISRVRRSWVRASPEGFR